MPTFHIIYINGLAQVSCSVFFVVASNQTFYCILWHLNINFLYQLMFDELDINCIMIANIRQIIHIVIKYKLPTFIVFVSR